MSRGLISKASKQIIISQKPLYIHDSMNPKDSLFKTLLEADFS